ncbi:hypothetical protein FE257_010765 [Aspergillus nanangensis]|uniref:Uncharacterized protein n=1 Tax=Aspergillus nanangensis TaxID=2582783 RepID=A0AAD4CVW2_ASPNN|nr:hypothetical protein FE257_010765 [Aspergillus nanangensis]
MPLRKLVGLSSHRLPYVFPNLGSELTTTPVRPQKARTAIVSRNLVVASPPLLNSHAAGVPWSTGRTRIDRRMAPVRDRRGVIEFKAPEAREWTREMLPSGGGISL